MKYQNNPANIRVSSRQWFGQLRPLSCSQTNFCEFSSLQMGVRALIKILHSYYFKHNIHNIAGILNRYAPASDHNNTIQYISYVCYRMSMKPTDNFTFNINNLEILVKSICWYETNTRISSVMFRSVYLSLKYPMI